MPVVAAEGHGIFQERAFRRSYPKTLHLAELPPVHGYAPTRPVHVAHLCNQKYEPLVSFVFDYAVCHRA